MKNFIIKFNQNLLDFNQNFLDSATSSQSLKTRIRAFCQEISKTLPFINTLKILLQSPGFEGIVRESL